MKHANANRNLQVITTAEWAEDYVAYQKMRHEHPELFKLYSTGITSLDRIMGGGIEKGQYGVIGGPPKGGKTTLMMELFKALLRQRARALYLTAEMTTRQMGNIMFSNISGIDRTRIRSMSLKGEDWKLLEDAKVEITEYPGYLNYGFSTVDDIDYLVDTVESEDGPLDAILIDYIQLMEVAGKVTNVVETVTHVSRRLKQRSIRAMNPMLVLAAAQLTRESIRKGLMDMQSFLGGSALERDMDFGWIVGPVIDKTDNQPYPNKRNLSVVGSRETDIGSVELAYNGRIGRIGDQVLQAKDMNRFQ